MSDEFDRASKQVAWDERHGIDPLGSIAVQLHRVRQIIAEAKEREAELEAWAKSGDFNLAVPGDPVHVHITEAGHVLIIPAPEMPNG